MVVLHCIFYPEDVFSQLKLAADKAPYIPENPNSKNRATLNHWQWMLQQSLENFSQEFQIVTKALEEQETEKSTVFISRHAKDILPGEF